MIKFTCKCGKQIKVDDKFAGKKGKCPRCKEAVIVPVENDTVWWAEKSTPKLEADICSRCYETIPSGSPRKIVDEQTVCIKCDELYFKKQQSRNDIQYQKDQNSKRKNSGPVRYQKGKSSRTAAIVGFFIGILLVNSLYPLGFFWLCSEERKINEIEVGEWCLIATMLDSAISIDEMHDAHDANDKDDCNLCIIHERLSIIGGFIILLTGGFVGMGIALSLREGSG